MIFADRNNLTVEQICVDLRIRLIANFFGSKDANADPSQYTHPHQDRTTSARF